MLISEQLKKFECFKTFIFIIYNLLFSEAGFARIISIEHLL